MSVCLPLYLYLSGARRVQRGLYHGEQHLLQTETCTSWGRLTYRCGTLQRGAHWSPGAAHDVMFSCHEGFLRKEEEEGRDKGWNSDRGEEEGEESYHLSYEDEGRGIREFTT